MRYVVFQFIGPAPSDARHAIERCLEQQLGRLNLARHGIKFMPEKYDHASATGLIRTDDAEMVRAALLFCGSAIHIKGVSGTIAGTEKFR